MANQTVRFDEATMAQLNRATSAEPARVQFAKGKRPVKVGEVLVAVFSSEGGVVRRAKVGRDPNFRELLLWLAGTEAAVERCAAEPSPGAPQLTAGEAALLDEAGFVEGEKGLPGALALSGIDYDLLLTDSLSLEQAAKLLHVKTTSRLRQRLADRTLYGIKDGKNWRVPKFQFVRGKLVRGIDQVFPHIRRDAHPLAVKSWFSTPHQDLVVGKDDQRVTPLAWLAAGNSPEEVARLAAEI